MEILTLMSRLAMYLSLVAGVASQRVTLEVLSGEVKIACRMSTTCYLGPRLGLNTTSGLIVQVSSEVQYSDFSLGTRWVPSLYRGPGTYDCQTGLDMEVEVVRNANVIVTPSNSVSSCSRTGQFGENLQCVAGDTATLPGYLAGSLSDFDLPGVGLGGTFYGICGNFDTYVEGLALRQTADGVYAAQQDPTSFLWSPIEQYSVYGFGSASVRTITCDGRGMAVVEETTVHEGVLRGGPSRWLGKVSSVRLSPTVGYMLGRGYIDRPQLDGTVSSTGGYVNCTSNCTLKRSDNLADPCQQHTGECVTRRALQNLGAAGGTYSLSLLGGGRKYVVCTVDEGCYASSSVAHLNVDTLLRASVLGVRYSVSGITTPHSGGECYEQCDVPVLTVLEEATCPTGTTMVVSTTAWGPYVVHSSWPIVTSSGNCTLVGEGTYQCAPGTSLSTTGPDNAGVWSGATLWGKCGCSSCQRSWDGVSPCRTSEPTHAPVPVVPAITASPSSAPSGETGDEVTDVRSLSPTVSSQPSSPNQPAGAPNPAVISSTAPSASIGVPMSQGNTPTSQGSGGKGARRRMSFWKTVIELLCAGIMAQWIFCA